MNLNFNKLMAIEGYWVEIWWAFLRITEFSYNWKTKQPTLFIIEQLFSVGWWFVWNELDQQGWAPATYLEPIGAENEEDNDEWVIVDDSNHGNWVILYRNVIEKLYVNFKVCMIDDSYGPSGFAV